MGATDCRRPGIGLWYPSPSEYDPHAFIASLSDSFAGEIARWYAQSREVQRWEGRIRAAAAAIVVAVVAGVVASALSFSLRAGAIWIAGTLLVGVAVLALLLSSRRRWPQRKLLLRARVVSERARFSTTQRQSSELGGEGGRGVVARAKRLRERELVERPATLSSLVNEFRGLAANAGHVTGGVVIAIDELDKMSDPDKVRALLRDIKAIFEVPGVHFLVSVSDEAARNLSLGSLTSRNEFNSSFYTVLQAQPARPEDCVELLERRCNVPREVSLALAILGGGNPREVVRLAELVGPVTTPGAAAMVVLGEEALALRREVVTAEPVASLADLGQEASEGSFLALPDEAFARPDQFAQLCDHALGPALWEPPWADDGWAPRFRESWSRLMVRLAVGGQLMSSPTLVRDTDLTDRLLDVIVAAGQSGQVARIVLTRNLRIESRRPTPDAPGETRVREELRSIAREYENVRASNPSGTKRTGALDRLASNARRLTREANFSTEEVHRLLESSAAGDRVIGLATVQATADPAAFGDVVDAVRTPRTPFEQYHALRAIESLQPGLTPKRRDELVALLGDTKWREGLHGDASRSNLADRILKGLGTEATRQADPKATRAPGPPKLG